MNISIENKNERLLIFSFLYEDFLIFHRASDDKVTHRRYHTSFKNEEQCALLLKIYRDFAWEISNLFFKEILYIMENYRAEIVNRRNVEYLWKQHIDIIIWYSFRPIICT